MHQLVTSCVDCGISKDIIDRQSFSCFEESLSFVTYRARLEGTSEADSGFLISLIEDWVRRGGASVIVTGILMRIDSNCPVVISSFGETECSKPTPPVPTTSVHTLPVPTPPVSPNEPSRTQTLFPSIKHNFTEDSGNDSPTFSSQNSASATDNTPAIIGGVVVTVLFLMVLAILIIVIAALVLKNRQLTIKTAEKLVIKSLGVYCQHSLTVFLSLFHTSIRLQMTVVPQGSIPTSTNAAYEMVDVNRDTRCNTPSRDGEEGKYEVPCPPTPSQVCLSTLSPLFQPEEEVYEVIPGENN